VLAGATPKVSRWPGRGSTEGVVGREKVVGQLVPGEVGKMNIFFKAYEVWLEGWIVYEQWMEDRRVASWR